MAFLGNIVTLILIAYLSYSTYEIARLWFPPLCDPLTEPSCVKPGFSFAENFDLHVFSVSKARSMIEWSDKPFFSKLDVNLNEPFQERLSIPWKENRETTRSLHLAVIATPKGKAPKPPTSEDLKNTLYTTYELIKFMPVVQTKKKFLLGEEGKGDEPKAKLENSTKDTKVEDKEEGQSVAHYKPLLKLRLVNDYRSYSPLPEDVSWTFMDHSRKAYRPFFYADELHVYRSDLVPVSFLNVSHDPEMILTFSPTSIGAYRLLKQLEGTIVLMKTQFGFQEKETEQILMIFSPDNMYRLILTGVVTVLHTLFAFLAFKNDVGFWRGREDLAGLSRRSVIGHAVCSVIILLFLYDSPSTSWLVLGTLFVSTLIDVWKVSKVLRISSRNHQNSSQENETDQHDSQGMYYLSLILYPLVIIWAIYSLFYNAHRSWWSWLISSAANGVYAFGFLMMTPQIFINYKLKSVAHLPWRAMTYKVFNTFVDDIFAFIIEMPTIHRLATLRDDLIFFIYLYQRWIYPVDKKRANEFGYTAEETAKPAPISTEPVAPASTDTKIKTE